MTDLTPQEARESEVAFITIDMERLADNIKADPHLYARERRRILIAAQRLNRAILGAKYDR
jgi:hypothetical protein